MNVVVLGTGCAAWGVHHRLTGERVSAQFHDKNPYGGGHTASFENNGFVFDDGPHISFTEIPELQEVFAAAVGHEYESLHAVVDNWYHGVWVKHPAITYLHALPTDLVVRCVTDFIAASHADEPESIASYRDWLRAAYGQTFADEFPAVYGRKYHTCGPEEMNTSWLGPRLYRPSLEEVIEGAVAPPRAEKHYIDKFRYPKRDGFVAYLNEFLRFDGVHLGNRARTIDPVGRTVGFSNGTIVTYDHLISSVPLPEIVKMIENVPIEVRTAAEKLACSQCVVVNIGVSRSDLSPSHWRYIYDADRPSVRLSFPHMFSPSTVPEGCGAVQVEVYYSNKYKPLDHHPDEDIVAVKKDLLDFGVLREEDEILVEEARFIEYANVIFDHDSDACAALVKAYLAEIGIETCGRYGDWAYAWTDQSFASGVSAAERVLDRR